MAKWYNQWLTTNEQKHLQVGQKGIRARKRKQDFQTDQANRAIGTANAAANSASNRVNPAKRESVESSSERIRNALKKRK